MIKLGEYQTLEATKRTDNGIYLKTPDNSDSTTVLLPKNQVPETMGIGDLIEVFIYKDSEDRLIATTIKPKLTIGQFAMLEVLEVNQIGAFLDWGLAKDLLLPFKEQKEPLNKGDKVFVSLYIDKSTRLCATTKIYDLLSCEPPYQKDDKVIGTIFGSNPNYGIFVAVDDKYCALIPQSELSTELCIGQSIQARVVAIRPDGKMNLSLKDKINEQIDKDSQIILDMLKFSNGYLPYTDKTSPDIIRDMFKMSKSSYKRALGRLYKEEKIQLEDDGIRLLP